MIEQENVLNNIDSLMGKKTSHQKLIPKGEIHLDIHHESFIMFQMSG